MGACSERHGNAPSLAANASGVAFVRDGWVWFSKLTNGGGLRRIVRGSAPALSPDSRSLAYVGAQHHVFVVSLRGGRPRRVGRVQAVALDWGPRPASQTCSPPAQKVVARSSQGAVWVSVSARGDAQSVTVYECAVAVGIRRTLVAGRIDVFREFSVTSVAAAGDYAALDLYQGDYDHTVGPDQVAVYDLRTGRMVAQSSDLCVYQDAPLTNGCPQVDSLQVNTAGFAVWHQAARPGSNPAALVPETVVASDDAGVRTLDSVPAGSGQSLTEIRLGPDSVTWLHDGIPHSAPLS